MLLFSFTCGGTSQDGGCGRVLPVENYVDHNTDPYCVSCYNRLFAESDRLMAIVKAGEDAKKNGLTKNNMAETQKKLDLLSVDEAPKCVLCAKVVYKYDEHKALDKMWHKSCFICGGTGSSGTGCEKLLSLSVFGEHGNEPFCIKCCQTKFNAYLNSKETGLREVVDAPWPPPKQLDPWGEEEVEENEDFWVDLASKAARDRVFKREVIEVTGPTTQERTLALFKDAIVRKPA
jgi:hypothetical protein